MKTPKTKEQIDAEIVALKELRDKIPKTSFFGDDNVAAIDAQIKVLERKMTDNEVYKEFGDDGFDDDHSDDFSQHALDAALTAADWLVGEEDIGSLAEDWASLVK